MNWLQQQLQNTPPPDTILHLGAGLCRELPHWLEADASRIVLVEPNPELLPELRARTEDHESVEVVSTAIAGQAGRGALRLFNFPLLSSMREPTGLYQILPGLRQIGRAMVETVTVDQLLEGLNLKAGGEHWLVIDIPGEEAAILEQLERSDQLYDFNRIFLSAGAKALHQGAERAQDLAQRLQAAGYSNAGRLDLNDADWPRRHLRLDRMALECKRLNAKLVEAQQAQERDSKKVQALESALTEQKTTSEKLGSELHERKKDLARLTQADDEAQQKLTEAEQKLASLPEQRKRLKALEEEATNLRAQLETKSKQAAESTERVNKLEAALAERSKQAEELNATLQSQKQELATAKDQRAKLTEQLEALKTLETQQKQTQQQLEQVTQSRDNLTKQLQKHSEEAHKLKIRVSQLEEENEDYQERHKLLEEELIKAEAQIELIKQLFLSGDDALDFDDNEPEKG